MSFRVLSLCLLFPLASAWAGEQWETIASGALNVKIRDLPNTHFKEVWAEGAIAAPVQDIQAVLMSPNRFPQFMPYVKEAGIIEIQPDGTQYVYTRLDLPFLQSRDYVLKVTLVQGVQPDGSGTFQNQWFAVPEKIPKRKRFIRLTHNQGGWVVTALPNGKSHAVYRFSFDPGGWVPGFVADMGNKQAVQSTYDAVEKEAQRRASVRRAKAAALAASDAGVVSVDAGVVGVDAGTVAAEGLDAGSAAVVDGGVGP
jgi:hypothetical protein